MKIQRGFSLIELLVVLSIISLLAALAGPAFNAMLNSVNTSEAGYQVQNLLDYARSEAVAKNTYVWVGFQNASTDELIAGAVFSVDGTGTNTASSNVVPLIRTMTFQHVQLGKWSDLPGSVQALATGKPTSVAANISGISFTVGKWQFNQKQTITFTPNGEAILSGSVDSTTGYDSLIDVSIIDPRHPVQSSSVTIQGASGSTSVLNVH